MEIKIEGDLKEGIFIKRVNRFIAQVLVENNLERVHVANTGRMKELLIEGARVIVRKVDNHNRKTKYDLLMVYKNDTLVLIDSKMPNILMEKAFREKKLRNFNCEYDDIKREINYGSSRFDIGLINDKEMVLVENKCVTLVKTDNIASFPDAPTERGRKHICELIRAKEKGLRAAVFFIIQRNDAKVFTPNKDMDEKFAKAVKEAYDKGVEFYAYICDVSIDKIKIFKEIPVIIN